MAAPTGFHLRGLPSTGAQELYGSTYVKACFPVGSNTPPHLVLYPLCLPTSSQESSKAQLRNQQKITCRRPYGPHDMTTFSHTVHLACFHFLSITPTKSRLPIKSEQTQQRDIVCRWQQTCLDRLLCCQQPKISWNCAHIGCICNDEFKASAYVGCHCKKRCVVYVAKRAREVWDTQMFAELKACIGSSCQPITEEHRRDVQKLLKGDNFPLITLMRYSAAALSVISPLLGRTKHTPHMLADCQAHRDTLITENASYKEMKREMRRQGGDRHLLEEPELSAELHTTGTQPDAAVKHSFHFSKCTFSSIHLAQHHEGVPVVRGVEDKRHHKDVLVFVIDGYSCKTNARSAVRNVHLTIGLDGIITVKGDGFEMEIARMGGLVERSYRLVDPVDEHTGFIPSDIRGRGHRPIPGHTENVESHFANMGILGDFKVLAPKKYSGGKIWTSVTGRRRCGKGWTV
ncbi:hypothetical protein PAMP_007859 [Pampus punctatissimus]